VILYIQKHGAELLYYPQTKCFKWCLPLGLGLSKSPPPDSNKMSTLSRFPSTFAKPRSVLGDRTNEGDDGEKDFLDQSRKSMKQTRVSSVKKPPKGLNASSCIKNVPKLSIAISRLSGVSRVKAESEVLSPPLQATLSMHERKTNKGKGFSPPKRRNLVELGGVGGLSRSSSASSLSREQQQNGTQDKALANFKLDSGVQDKMKEKAREAELVVAEKSMTDAKVIFEKLSRIEMELSKDAEEVTNINSTGEIGRGRRAEGWKARAGRSDSNLPDNFILTALPMIASLMPFCSPQMRTEKSPWWLELLSKMPSRQAPRPLLLPLPPPTCPSSLPPARCALTPIPSWPPLPRRPSPPPPWACPNPPRHLSS